MGGEVTSLLRDLQAGDQRAADQLMPLVYEQLRSLAGHYMRCERFDHTLRPTAVVHEAYLKLADPENIYADRVHFFAIAAKAMRQILLDWARANHRIKRGSGALKVELKEDSAVALGSPEIVFEVNRLLDRLAEFDDRKAKIVEMVFFGGMTYDETAKLLGITAVTVHRDLKMAKAWMLHASQTQEGNLES
jgi:RNA polymerase sigma-70 factor (ECF subfamily)